SLSAAAHRVASNPSGPPFDFWDFGLPFLLRAMLVVAFAEDDSSHYGCIAGTDAGSRVRRPGANAHQGSKVTAPLRLTLATKGSDCVRRSAAMAGRALTSAAATAAPRIFLPAKMKSATPADLAA